MGRGEKLAYLGIVTAGLGAIVGLGLALGSDPLLILTANLSLFGVAIGWVSYRYRVSQVPKPDVTIISEGRLLNQLVVPVRFVEPRDEFEVEVANERQRLEEALARMQGSYAPNVAKVIRGVFQMPTKEQLEHYKTSDIPAYLDQYRDYLLVADRHKSFWAKTTVLILALRNERAQVPADGVRVILRFPEGQGLHVLHIDEAPEEDVEAPVPPSPPQPRAWYEDLLKAQYRWIPDLSGLRQQALGGMSAIDVAGNVSGPLIRRGSIIVEYQVGEILHNLPEDTRDEPILLQFDRTGRWEVPYEIHARNLPQPRRGQFVVDANHAPSKDAQ